MDQFFRLGKGEPVGDWLVHDAGRFCWVESVVVDVQVDLVGLAGQLVERGDDVTLRSALLSRHGVDGGVA